MREELKAKLLAKYPVLLRNTAAEGDRKVHLEVGDGWYNILDILFGTLESRKYNNEHLPIPQVIIVSISAHRSRLRIGYELDIGNISPAYLIADGGKAYSKEIGFIEGAIQLAEGLSTHTCEACGNPGRKRTGKWLTTLCDRHFEEFANKTSIG